MKKTNHEIDKDCLPIFGTGALNLGGTLRINNDKIKVVVSHKLDPIFCSKSVYVDGIDEYTMSYIPDGELSDYDDLMEYVYKCATDTVICISINTFLRIFHGRDILIITAIREHVFDYVDQINEAEITGMIVSFDNSESIANELSKRLDRFKVYKGVADIVVPFREESIDRIEVYTSGDIPFFAFPEEARNYGIKEELSRVVLLEDDLLEQYKKAKFLFVNGPQMIMSILMLHYHNYSEDTYRIHFKDDPNIIEIVRMTRIFEKTFISVCTSELDEEVKEVWKPHFSSVIDYTMRSEFETPERILPPKKSSYEKLQAFNNYFAALNSDIINSGIAHYKKYNTVYHKVS